VEAGEFRDSLYYRLDGIQVEVPPLRDRQADVFPLVTELLHELVPTGTTAPGISPKAWQAIEAHEFSGNVRELRWVLEQALAASNGAEIGPSHLPRALRRAEG
jgi:transcriptional regulator with PAS, ATPase and Fis domain